MSIVQGDHGYAIPFITRKDIILDLTGASVEVAIERGGEIINKQANILDPLTGKCEVVLSNKDLRLIGKYTYQWTAFLADGRILSGDPIDFLVKDKLRDLPFGDGEETKVVPFASQEDLDELKTYVDELVITGGGSVVADSATNGNIKVNNLEIVVYDESGIIQRIEALEASPGGSGSTVTDSSTNGNILVDGNEITAYDETAVIQRLSDIESAPGGEGGSTVTDSSTNGNILVDGTEIKVYDDAAITEQLADMVRSVNGVLPDANGNVAVETGSGGSSDITKGIEVLSADPTGTDLWEGRIWIVTSGTADTTDPVLTITAGGTFTGTKSVTMSTDETATIYYTLDGSTPTIASAVYSSALSISATTTLKAFAVDTAGNSSAIQTVTYTLEEVDTTAPTVTASPTAGTYASAQSVTLSADEPATIYYTLDGATPTTASSVYSAPISIDATKTIQFMAVDSAGNQSTPVSATYTISVAENTAPTAPTISLVSTDETTATIKLDTASTDTEDGTITTYEIYKDGILYGTVSSLAVNDTTQITGLTASTTYVITVKAKDSQGLLSPLSNNVSATTSAPIADTPYDANLVSISTSGTSTATVANGNLEVRVGSTVEDAAIGYFKKNLVISEPATYKMRFKVNNTMVAGGGQIKVLTVSQSPTMVVGTNTTINGKKKIDVWIENFGSGNQFSAPSIPKTPIANNQFYEVRLISDSTYYKVVLYDENGVVLADSGQYAWSGVSTSGTDPLWVWFGEPFTNYYSNVSFDVDFVEVI